MPSNSTAQTASCAQEIAGKCISVRLRMLHRLVTSIYDGTLRPLGLTANQGNLLTAISCAGPITPSELGHRLMVDPSTLTRTLGGMKTAGWIDNVCGPDARTRLVQLTSEGRELLENTKPLWDQSQEEARRLLGEDLVNALYAWSAPYLPTARGV